MARPDQPRESTMQIKFHGAVGSVTGSCYELFDAESGAHFLVDCGMKQGEASANAWNRRDFEFEPGSLQFVVLTHAHLDHCGLIPLLYKRGFRGQVLCTEDTARIAEVSLRDASRHSTLFNANDVERIRWREYGGKVLGRYHWPRQDVFVRYLRSAHIVGATSVQVGWGDPREEKTIWFSGDLGNNRQGEEFQPLMRHAMVPEPSDSTHSYVVMESTCGGRSMDPRAKSFEWRIQNLHKHIEQAVLERQGTLVIPCFAINRTQDVLFDLHYAFTQDDRFRDIPVYFDAGLASMINVAYANAFARTELDENGKRKPLWLNERLFEWMGLDADASNDVELLTHLLAVMLDDNVELPPGLDNHKSWVVSQWRRIWERARSYDGMPDDVGGPCIVVTGGGMCDGGPIANYLHKLVRNPRHTFLLTGYCCESTNGGKLLHLKNMSATDRARQRGNLSWDGNASIPLSEVRANIGQLVGYSGHTDHQGLIDWFFPDDASGCRPIGSTVFLTHGEDRSRNALRDALLERSLELLADAHGELRVELPNPEQGWFDLNRGEWLEQQETQVRSVTSPRPLPGEATRGRVVSPLRSKAVLA